MTIVYTVCEICFESSLSKHTVYLRWICSIQKHSVSAFWWPPGSTILRVNVFQ